ncbi:MAG: hypothetical protein ACI9KK_003024 [Ascidiaceihabitans sp.]|jgi:hypothetical protein
MEAVLELSWKAQVIISSGFVGYGIAYSGRRNSHKNSDLVAISLVFSALSLFVLETLLDSFPVGWAYRNQVASLSSLFTAVGVAVLWRAKLQAKVRKLLQSLKADQDDGFPTAWQTITQEPGMEYSQVLVTLKDGRALESYQMSPFDKLPNGSVVFGLDGSIAMYVNAITDTNDNRRCITSVTDDDGHRITYIPADQIAEVDLRRAEKSS